MDIVRDRLWIWGHEAGSHDRSWNTPAPSRMTPAEGAFYLGTPNLIMVRYDDKPEPPYVQYAWSFRPLKQFVWSIVGAAGVTSEDEIEQTLLLAKTFPNMTGVMMDDFFRAEPDAGGALTPERLAEIRKRLVVGDKRLDLWVVLYQYQLDFPIRDHLDQWDVITYWTWQAPDLWRLEQDFARLEELTPGKRKILGCYMWDYGNSRPIGTGVMRHQCELALHWLKGGRIEGIIFLASCICDLDIEAVEWTRDWIAKVGDRPIG
ncbi:MAG: hypothetical protein FJY97_13065 [candidate division Zixibacteria bacterium]|nr:hypothetical protein [candidate division Zixibacteria bacterium]